MGNVVNAPAVTALLLAGGVGERAGRGVPKQLANLDGVTVLERAVAVFARHRRIDRIVVVMPADLIERGTLLIPGVTVVAGGNSRQSSAARGLALIGDDNALVLIHDVARPFLPAEVIDRCLDALQTYHAVGTVIDSADTVYQISQDSAVDELVEVPERQTIRRAQTPQGFRCGVIRDAHRRAIEAGSESTDDCSVVLRHRPDVPIALVAGDETNFKLTTAADFARAKQLLDDGTLK